MSESVLSFDSDPAFRTPIFDVETGERLDDQHDRFIVDNDRKATWAMRKLLEHRAAVSEIRAVAQAEIDRVQEWAREQEAKHEHDLAYFEGLLIAYARWQREEHDRKSISTPYGTVKTRAGGHKWTVVDTEALMDYLRLNHPDWVRVKEEPQMAMLKDLLEIAETDTFGTVALDEGGVIVPGLAIEQAGIGITITTEEGR